MTVKERILSVYRNQLPDHVPIGIYNRYHRTGASERKAREAGLGILDFYPPVSLLAPPWHVQPGYLSEVKNTTFHIAYSWTNHKQLEERSFETPVGKLTQQIVKDPSFGSDWVVKPYIRKKEDYKIMQYVIENTVFAYHENVIIQRIKDMGEDGVVLGRVDRSPYQKILIELADPEQFLVDMYTDPALPVELMELIDFRIDEQFEIALNSGVDVIWQPDNITTDMTPPESFSKYCLPFYTKNGKKCKKAGKVYAVHIDGKAKLLQEQIKNAPIDVIESFSLKVMGGDIEIEEALASWPDKAICPNFPASLCVADDKEITDFLINTHNAFHNRPYMLQLSEDFSIDSYNSILKILTKTIQNEIFSYGS